MVISCVIPVYNEIGTIEELLRRLLAVDFAKEIILVDDGSTDGSREFLQTIADGGVEAISKAQPRNRNAFVVLFQDRNQGKGAALRRGFERASGDIVVIQDADLEYDPRDIPRVVQPILDGVADVVYGSRFIGSPRRVLYFWHTVLNNVLTTLSNMTSGLNVTDMETCYKAFRKEVLRGLHVDEDRFGFEPEITAKVARGGFRVYEVPVSYYGRTYEEGKKIGWRDGVRAVYVILKYALRR